MSELETLLSNLRYHARANSDIVIGGGYFNASQLRDAVKQLDKLIGAARAAKDAGMLIQQGKRDGATMGSVSLATDRLVDALKDCS